MSTPKRFYWMKLKESFMTSDTIDYFMAQPNGANYVVLYQMLCLKTINTQGRLSRQIGEIIIPYDVEKIRRDMKWFSADTIRVALELYKAVGLIYEDVDGTLVLTDHENLVGSETDAAARMRQSRNRGQLPPAAGVTNGERPANIVTPDIEIDIRDRDRERDKEIERKGDVSSLRSDTSPAPPEPKEASEPPVIVLPLNDGTCYPVYQEQCQEWAGLYPAVDVIQQLRNMRGWLDSNPNRKKTKSGIKRFINGWLSREQNQGSRTQQSYPQPRPCGSASGEVMDSLMALHQQFDEDGS